MVPSPAPDASSIAGVIPTGKRRGQSPSVASIYRALAAHAKAQSYPDAIDQAHTEFAALPTDSRQHAGAHTSPAITARTMRRPCSAMDGKVCR